MEMTKLNNKDKMISASTFFSSFFNQISILGVIGVIRYFQVKGYAVPLGKIVNNCSNRSY